MRRAWSGEKKSMFAQIYSKGVLGAFARQPFAKLFDMVSDGRQGGLR
jgi:hypothetical protein